MNQTSIAKRETLLNIAAVWPEVRTLGPGMRAVIWVQGCCFHCPGCISPEWIPDIPAYQVSPDELALNLLSASDFTGLTISGGEPMLQASALASLIHCIRTIRSISVICFSGFTYDGLQKSPPSSGIPHLLKEIDVLIDGQYIRSLNDNKGMRGSSNQKVSYLTDRLLGYDFENSPRRLELHIRHDYTLLAGVPPKKLPDTLQEYLEERSYISEASL